MVIFWAMGPSPHWHCDSPQLSPFQQDNFVDIQCTQNQTPVEVLRGIISLPKDKWREDSKRPGSNWPRASEVHLLHCEWLQSQVEPLEIQSPQMHYVYSRIRRAWNRVFLTRILASFEQQRWPIRDDLHVQPTSIIPEGIFPSIPKRMKGLCSKWTIIRVILHGI